MVVRKCFKTDRFPMNFEIIKEIVNFKERVFRTRLGFSMGSHWFSVRDTPKI